MSVSDGADAAGVTSAPQGGGAHADATVGTVPFRILPKLTERNRSFWQGGERGELVFWRCQDCEYFVHPFQPICPMCHSKNLAPEAVSGRATVATYSVNHQNWMPGPELPYTVAIVEIVEQPSVRLTTNLVNIDPDKVEIDMPVRVTFEHHPDPEGDVWIPLFEPYQAQTEGAVSRSKTRHREDRAPEGGAA